MSEQWGAGPQPQDPQQPGGGWPQQQPLPEQPQPSGGWPQQQQRPEQPPPGGSWPQQQSGGWPQQPEQPQPGGGWPQPPQQPEQQPGGSWPQQPQPGGAWPQQQPEGAQFGENPFPQQQQPGAFPGSGEYPQQQPFGGPGDYPGAGIPYPAGPGYPPGFPGGPPPPKQTNGFALAGAILCFLPLLGLIFSIIGLVRAKALGGAGRTAATVGIVLSVLFAGGYGFGLYKIGNSTAADPACISAETQVNAMESKLTADEAQMKADQNSSAEAGDFTNAANDLQTIKTSIDGDIGKATHANVKSALQTFDNDLGEMITDFNEIAAGNSAGVNDLESRMNQITTDGDNLDNLCGNAVNG
jgi:hypothetical protein